MSDSVVTRDLPSTSLVHPIRELRQTQAEALRLLDAIDSPLDAKVDPRLSVELRQNQSRLSALLEVIETRVSATPERTESDAIQRLERRMEALENENQDLTEQMVALENRAGQMMHLFVATYQLYAAQDSEEVQATIAEIAVDLLGAERFVLLWRESEDEKCRLALRRGFEDQATAGHFAGDFYAGGVPLVDKTLEDGVIRLGESDSDTLAAVPMRVQNVIVGVLVLLKLFDHKPALSSDDREILDLLAAHAASALFAADAYALAARKLHSLESLVKILQGGQ